MPEVSGGELILPNLPISKTETYIVNASDTPSNPDIHHLAVGFTGFGQALSKKDIYMSVLNTLIYIAKFNRLERLQPFGVSAPAPFDATLWMVQFSSPPPASAQTFDYTWAARNLLSISQIMQNLGMWREASFNVIFDGFNIGKNCCW